MITRSLRIFFKAKAWYLLFDSRKIGWLFAWFQIPKVLNQKSVLTVFKIILILPIKQFRPKCKINELGDTMSKKQGGDGVGGEFVDVFPVHDQITQNCSATSKTVRSGIQKILRYYPY